MPPVGDFASGVPGGGIYFRPLWLALAVQYAAITRLDDYVSGFSPKALCVDCHGSLTCQRYSRASRYPSS